MEIQSIHARVIRPAIGYEGLQEVQIRRHREFTMSTTGNTLTFGALSDGLPVVIKEASQNTSIEKEWQAYESLASSEAVPTPVALVELDETRKALVIERLFGPLLGTAASTHNLEASGRALHVMHQAGFAQDQNPKDSYEHRFSALGNNLRTSLLGKLAFKLYEQQPTLENISSTLLHHDVHENNIIVTARGARLIDFEWWQPGDDTEDLAIYLFHELKARRDDRRFVDFLAGYQHRMPLEENKHTRLLFHLALYCLEYYQFTANSAPSTAAYIEGVRTYINARV